MFRMIYILIDKISNVNYAYISTQKAIFISQKESASAGVMPLKSMRSPYCSNLPISMVAIHVIISYQA